MALTPRRAPAHAAAPLGIEVAHADLVVDGAALLAAVEHPAAAGAFAQRTALAVDREQVLVQVAAERPPDRVVVEHALRALRRRVALEPQAAELDRHPVRAERNRGVDAQH
jgi:hypothetical protein